MTPDSPLTPAERAAAANAEPTYVPVIPAPEPYVIPKLTAVIKRKDPATGKSTETRHPLTPKHKPSSITEYRNPDGGLCFAVCRWEAGTSGLPRKHISPLTFDGKEWRWKGMPAPRPLLHAPLLAAQPTAPVLIVEGEKTATAAPRYAPEGWLVTTWNGGSGGWAYSDWSLLSGHRCVIWLDNDQPGWKASVALLDHLQKLGIAASVIPYMESWPDGWDLADPLPDGIAPEQITAKILQAGEQAYAPTPKTDEQPPVVADLPAPADPDSVVNDEFQPVGYNNQTFYLMSKRAQQIHEFTASRLLKKDALLEIVPSHAWWGATYGNSPTGGIQWEHIGAQIIESCYAAGIFNYSRIRGRGVWFDKGRIVLHTGDQLVVDGSTIKPSQIKSDYIYPVADKIADLDGIAPLTDEQARNLRKLCNQLRWTSEVYGDMFCGLIATAVVCGALKWRTHGWVTAPRGAGKSFIAEQIIARCLGDIALYPLGVSTEAGIRQELYRDALPVIFDEAEGRGQAGVQRRERIIELMRMAAQDSRGRIFKGGSNHSGTQFTIRSQFILASIDVGLREGADETRCIVMTLKSTASATREGRAAQEKHFSALNQTLAEQPSEMASKLLLRMTKLIPVLRQNVETFSSVIAVHLGDRRLGDRLGTPLAGCWTLVMGNEPASEEAVRAYISKFDWTEFTKQDEIREDLAILRHINASVVRAQMNGSLSADRAVGELVAVAAGYETDERMTARLADENLRRYGMRYDEKDEGFFISNHHPGLDGLMADSVYAQGYARIIARHEMAKSSGKAVRFAGVVSNAIWLPAWVMAGLEEKPVRVAGRVPDDQPLPYDEGDDYPR